MRQFVETYQQIKKENPLTLRAGLRNLVLSGLALKDKIAGIEQFLETPRVQFLYIHHSFKDELHQLDRLMKELSINHSFISYSEAVEMVVQNKIDKPYISFSSDDGFKNNLLAAEVLNAYGAKACFFINPGLIGENDFGRIKSHCKDKLHLPPVEFLNWDDVSQLMDKGHEIGGHTIYHDNMAGMTEAELIGDVTKTYEIIEKNAVRQSILRFLTADSIISMKVARKAVFDTGFRSCASAERGCHFNGALPLSYDSLCIRRDHVILDWHLDQIMYFIANNVRHREAGSNLFPYPQRK